MTERLYVCSKRIRRVVTPDGRRGRGWKLLLLAVALVGGMTSLAAAQQGQQGMPGTPGAGLQMPQQPQTYTIQGITIETGDGSASTGFVRETSGLSEGQQITLPVSDAVSQAVRRLYRVGAFSDVSVEIDRIEDTNVYLLIKVEEEQTLASISFGEMDDDDAEKIRERSPLARGRAVRQSDIERTKKIIAEHYEQKGYRHATTEVERNTLPDGRLALEFHVDRGPKVEVERITFHGNTVYSDFTLRRQMETKANRWWRIWKGEKFDRNTYEQDLQTLIDYYNEDGYYDARVTRDTVYYAEAEGDGPSDGLVIEVTIHEGSQYHVRNITWEGNVEYDDARLTQALGFEKGDVFNTKVMHQNLRSNQRGDDVSSLYMNRGFLRFNVQPAAIKAPGDSVDLHFTVNEGEIYEFGTINITGNQKTKDHVVRRELRTLPGQKFSRQAIQRSIRQLQQLKYFSSQELAKGPQVTPNDEDNTVDLTYGLKETGSDQLELSGGWGGGSIGILLRAGLSFNNFSAQGIFDAEEWTPLPTGDGQRLSLNAQLGGRRYQTYSISFREPWFLGRPNPFGISLSHRRTNFGAAAGGMFGTPFRGGFGGDTGGDLFTVTQGNVSYGHRLDWPDDYFETSTELGMEFYNVGANTIQFGLPPGRSRKLSLTQSLSRNSLDRPRFPTSGSQVSLSMEVAPPVGEFIQYHKWNLDANWNMPIIGKLTLATDANFGYIGSLTGSDVSFDRFLIGGTPLEARGFYFGKDLIFMRGYPLQSITPREEGRRIGGRILNKYSAELRILGIESPQLQLAPYLFFDAANTWRDVNSANPMQLYRSTGVGARIFLPILGMAEVSYGYQIDPFPAQGNNGQPQWRFQFTLGQTF